MPGPSTSASSLSPLRRGSAAIDALNNHRPSSSTQLSTVLSSRRTSVNQQYYDPSVDQQQDKGSNGIIKGSTVHHQQHLQQQHYQQQQKQQQPTVSMATIDYMVTQQALKKTQKMVKIADGGIRSVPHQEEHSSQSSVIEGQDDGDYSIGEASMSTLTSYPTVMSSATYQ